MGPWSGGRAVGLLLALVAVAGVVTSLVVAGVPALRRRAASAGRGFRHRSVERYLAWTAGLPRGAATVAWLTGWWVALLAVTWASGWLLTTVPADGGPWFDRAASRWFAGGRAPLTSGLLEVVTDAGDIITLGLLAMALGVFWRVRRGDWVGLQAIATGFGGAVLLYSAAKPLVGRARPDLELAVREIAGLAFPSGHATGGAAFYATLALLVAVLGLPRPTTVTIVGACLTLVPLIAVSRLYLGAHWVTDVVFGTVLGTTWAWVAATPMWARGRSDHASSSRA